MQDRGSLRTRVENLSTRECSIISSRYLSLSGKLSRGCIVVSKLPPLAPRLEAKVPMDLGGIAFLIRYPACPSYFILLTQVKTTGFVQGVFTVLEVLELDFLKCRSWKTLENSHINDEVL